MKTPMTYLLKELNNHKNSDVITVEKLKDIIVNSIIKAEKDLDLIISSEDYIH